jgi:cyanophycinase
MPRRRILPALILVPLAGSVLAAGSSGPPKGTLVLDGGGCNTAWERFVSLAGGSERNFVFIPTGASAVRMDGLATGEPRPDAVYRPPETSSQDEQTQKLAAWAARELRVRRVTVLHTRDRKEANSHAFVAPLRTAHGIWIGAGNAGRLAAAYLDTRMFRELWAFLERGGVILGTSAGAIISGSYTVRGRPDKPILMAKGHERGFGFIKNVAVNPHLIGAHREEQLIDVVDAHPELLGIGIDNGAGIVVRGDEFEVIGESKVAIYDNVKRDGAWYYWLSPGDRFDLRTRTARLKAAAPPGS